VGRLTETRGAKRLVFTGIGLAAAGLALTGCGAGFDAQSQQLYQPAVGINHRVGDIYVINTLVVTDGKGNGTLVCALVNQQTRDDTLKSVSAADGQGSQLQVVVPSSGVRLPARQSVQLADSGAVRVNGASLQAGSIITLTLTFAQAAPVTIESPVVDDSPTYSQVPVGPMRGSTS
jgi:copper(I)-binding protein